jgi:hypothetical protein
MNRRFQNSLTALLASASALALCLALAMPASDQAAPGSAIAVQLGPVDATFTPSDASRTRQENLDALTRSIERRADRVETLADAATLAAEIATATALAQAVKNAGESDTDTEHKARTAARHRRQTLVMPYFSFAPRG